MILVSSPRIDAELILLGVSSGFEVFTGSEGLTGFEVRAGSEVRSGSTSSRVTKS